MRFSFILIIMLFFHAPFLGMQAGAQNASLTRSYDEDLIRLASLLGSLAHLEPLCYNGKDLAAPSQSAETVSEQSYNARNDMEALLAAENPSGQRKAVLIDNFNRSFRSFAAIHLQCTKQSKVLLREYQNKASNIAENIANLYGQ
jgi:uncharacterized protein (TIGR02301 family)